MRTAARRDAASLVAPLVLACLQLAAPGHALAQPSGSPPQGGTKMAPALAGDTWQPESPLLTPRRLLAAAAGDDGKVYALGGCGSACFEPPLQTSTFEPTRVEVYDPRTKTWTARQPMPVILFGAAAVAPGDGKIYTLGGVLSGNVVQQYDPLTDSWTLRREMPTPRFGLAAVALGGKIYAIGGSGPSNAVEMYDPATDTWTPRASLPTARVYLAAAALDGKIYAMGGSPDCCGDSQTAAVEVYDPAANMWKAVASLPLAMQLSGAAVANGRVYVFAGFIPGAGAQGATFEYTPERDAWVTRQAMPAPRDQAAVVAVPAVPVTPRTRPPGDPLQAPDPSLGTTVEVVGGAIQCHCQALANHDRYTPPQLSQVADLAIQLIPGQTVASACQPVRYRIIVTNMGPDPARGAVVSDRFPAALSGITWSCQAPAGASCTKAGAVPGHDFEDVVDLPAGLSVTYEISANLDPAAIGVLVDQAALMPPAGLIDPHPANLQSQRFTTPIVGRIAPTGCCTNTGGPGCVPPRLSESIAATSEPATGTPTPLAIGEVVRYRLQTELPVGFAPGLTFTDTLPAGLLWMPGSCALIPSPSVTIPTGFPTFTGSSGPPTFTGPGAFSPTLTVNFSTVTTSGPGPGALAVECNALVLNSAPGSPPITSGLPAPNHFTATVSPRIGPPVTLTSNVVPAVIVEPAGGLVQQELPAATPTQVGYRLTYTNTGTATAYDVDIHDALPASLKAGDVKVKTSPSSFSCTGNSPPPTGPVDVTCPQVPPGGTVTVTFAAAVLPLCVSATNQATLTYTSLPGLHGTIPNPTRGFPPGAPGAPRGKRIYTSSASTVSQHCPDLAIEKSHDVFNLSPFRPPLGGNFTLTVTNVGNTPSVPNATVTDVLPAGLLCSQAGGNDWTCTCSSSSQTVSCTRTTPILPNESSSISIAVELLVVGSLPSIPGPYINCASLATTFDFNPNNDTSCVEVPFCIGFADASKTIPNMISWFPFDETEGSFAVDWASGVLALYRSDPNSPQPAPGMVSGALCFNPPGSYVDVPPGPPGPPSCPGPYDLCTDDLTIDTWVKTNASSGLQPILDKRQLPGPFFASTLSGYNFFLFNGLVAFEMADGLGSTDWVAPAGTGVADGTWHHVAVTVVRDDPAGGIFYVDCVPVGTFDPTGRPGNLTNGADLWIAAEYDINGGPVPAAPPPPAATLSGCLDELEIFNRALSPQEIQAFCTAGAYGKCKFKFFPH